MVTADVSQVEESWKYSSSFSEDIISSVETY